MKNVTYVATVLALLLPAAAQNKPAAKPPTPVKTSWASLAELEADFQERRLQALEQYLNEKKTASDRDDALVLASDLAFELGKHQPAQVLAEKFIAEFGSDDRARLMKLRKAACLATAPTTEAAARAAYQELVDDDEDVGMALQAAEGLIGLLLDAKDVAGAKAVYEKFGEKHGKLQGLKQELTRRSKNLDVIGQEPTPIDVKGMDEKPIRLADYKGKVLLIDFWATWCGPCIQELPNVLDAYKKHHANGFEIVGISLDRENDKAKLEKFVKDRGMTWPQFFDGKYWQNEVAVAYGVKSIPATYLLDKEGKVYRVGLRGKDLERAVAKLLGPAPAAAPAPGAAPAGKEKPKAPAKGK